MREFTGPPYPTVPTPVNSLSLFFLLFFFSFPQSYVSASFYAPKGGDLCRSPWEKQGSTRHQARWSASPRLTKPTLCTPRNETRKEKRCTVSTTPPPLVAKKKDGHRNQVRRLRAGCSLPGPRRSRLGRWDAFVTHQPLNPHCVPSLPAAFRQTQTWPCGAGVSMGIRRPRSHPFDDDVDKDAALQDPQNVHPDDTHSTHSEKPAGSPYAT